MSGLSITTREKREVIDLTYQINDHLKNNNFLDGAALIFVRHSTSSLVTCDLDPGTEKDYLDALEKIVPELNYVHPHDPSHVGDHILSTILGTSLVVPVKSGKMVMGTYQKIALFEFDGPRERHLELMLLTGKFS